MSGIALALLKNGISVSGSDINKNDRLKEIESNGGKVVKSISKKTNYLIAGEKMGPKKKLKAEELGIQLISENNFISLLWILFLKVLTI